jgi:two-component system, sensor histidine kinase and response regulator
MKRSIFDKGPFTSGAHWHARHRKTRCSFSAVLLKNRVRSVVRSLEEAEITELLNQGWVPVKPLKKSDYEAPARTPLQAQDGIPDQLPPFDIQAALVRNNGKPKLICKLLRTFHDWYANAVSELQSHLNENKPEEAERLAHSLKSLAGALEAKELSEAALPVENTLRAG